MGKKFQPVRLNNYINNKKMKKKVFAILALLCTVVQGAWADTWDGSSESRPYIVTTIKFPEKTRTIRVEIHSAAQLAYISNHWGETMEGIGISEDLDDIDINLLVDVDMTAANWTPMGSARYTGTFDGQGHTIKYKIDDSSRSSNFQGLFETIGGGGKVKDLHVDTYIKVGNARMVGGIAGNNYGTIENCWVNGHVESDHYHSSKDADLGGIVGLNESGGTVKYCFMSGDVKNTDGNSGVGGIAGSNEGTIEHVTFFGSVSVDHKQDNKWVGDQDNTLNNNYDSFNQSEYDSASGNDMYRRGLKYCSSNLFVISSDADWRAFLDYINHCCNFSGKSVRLDCDVSTSSTVSNSEFNAFRGTFDGNGHTININIKDTGIEGLALFRFINGATIKNLNLTGSITGGKYVAALVGIVNGTGNRIEGCAARVTVRGKNNIGGLVGHARSSGLVIDGCVFNGPLKMIGGLVWPYSSGIFIGGCDNGSNMSVSNCLLIGEGGYWGFRYAPGSVSQTNIYSKGDNAREAVPAGIGTLLKDYGLVRTYEHGISYNDRYYVDNNFALSGLGTEDDPVLIGSTADWDKLTDGIRGGYNFGGKFVKLTRDISVTTMAGTVSGSVQGTAFSGTFNGDGHTITATITDTNNQGTALFRYINGATIKDLKVVGTVTGDLHAAAIVGFAGGTGNSIQNCVASATVSGGSHIGGLLGHGLSCDIAITGCVYSGTMTGGSTAKGAIFGWGDAGGNKSLTDCLYIMQDGQNTDGLDLVRKYAGDVTVTNCYKYTVEEYEAQNGQNASLRSPNAPLNNNEDYDDEDYDITDLDSYGIWANVYETMPDYFGELLIDYGFLKVYEGGLEYEGEYYVASISLAADADNSTLISLATDYIVDVTLTGCTLRKDGTWQTLCLPFDVAFEGSPLEGAKVMTLGNSRACKTGFDASTGTLTLDFVDANMIEAGVAYIVKWEKPDGYDGHASDFDISNPLFRGATIANEAPEDQATTSRDGYVQFVGTYNTADIYTADKTNLYFDPTGSLCYPWGEGMTSYYVNACSAYFQLLNGLTADDSYAYKLLFNGTQTGVSLTPDPSPKGEGSDYWYTLDGRKLDSKPTQKGIYIHQGKKVKK